MPYWPSPRQAPERQNWNMLDPRHDAAEAHWQAVSRATQLATVDRDQAWRRRTAGWRNRLGLLLMRAGMRVAGPVTLDRPVPEWIIDATSGG
jgi:hypothetical protein